MTRHLALLFSLPVLAAAACVSPKVSYVQPGYPSVRYEDLVPPAVPRPVRMSFTHLWNGERQKQFAQALLLTFLRDAQAELSVH
jgi:hypothetical protein